MAGPQAFGPAKGSAAENLKRVRHKIIVMSGKGGVGKSTVAVNLASDLATRGFKVGILDADMHGPTVPRLLGMKDPMLNVNDAGRIMPAKGPKNISVISIAFLLREADAPVIWRGPVKMGAIKQFLEEVEWGELDYLIVDLPPGTGDEPLSVAQLVPEPDGALIVTTPQDVALISVRKSINFAKATGLKVIGMIENMAGFSCPHCGKDVDLFGRGKVEATAKDFSVPYLGRLPMSPIIATSGEDGIPFVISSEDGAAKSFREVTDGMMAILEKKGGKAG
jgi:ATP-binding protein involved in chromosome partitioning